MSKTALQLKISIFDALEPVLIRPNVTIERLLQDILREFSNELDLNQQYTLIYEGQVLPLSTAIGALGIPPDSTLSLSYRESNQPQWTAAAHNVTQNIQTVVLELSAVKTGKRFTLHSLPALIGRYSQRDQQVVDVDLSDQSGADTVSRRHARLTSAENVYSITRLENTNPLIINGVEIAVDVAQPLNHGDLLRLGEVELRVESYSNEIDS